jgi:hypothetical protein
MCERRMELSQQISLGWDYFKRAIKAQTDRKRERAKPLSQIKKGSASPLAHCIRSAVQEAQIRAHDA